MVKVPGARFSFDAHGWLGKGTYKRVGLVSNPYPLGLFNFREACIAQGETWRSRKIRWAATNWTWNGFRINVPQQFLSFYYSNKGWCYQIRRTWHGIVQIAMHPPISVGTNTLDRAQWRDEFRKAIEAWQALTGLQKGVWGSYNYPRHASGYNRFIRDYLKKRYPMSALLPVYKQQWLQAEAVRAPGVNPATFTDLGISGVWQFADGLTRVIVLKFPFPLDIDIAEDVNIYLGWSSPAQSLNCRWQVEYLFRKDDEAMDAAAQATLTQTETSSAVANGLVVSSFTIPAADMDADDRCLFLRISRLGGDALDTLGDVADLSGVCFHYTSDKLGGTI